MKKVGIDEMQQVQGGVGYIWKCSTCGYSSEWHAFRYTAEANANTHASLYGHKTAVYYA